jgi:dipeptidyl aminopeptidase/acylaminoacyl peptidase
MVHLISTWLQPGGAGLDGKNERRLTNLNEALWKQIQFADVDRFTYKSADDWDVNGFFVKPCADLSAL